MPGKREEGVYSITELSPSARKRVLEEWRYKIWDQNDSDWLGEDFKETLSERGFSNPKVYWSLNGCQGDGVAFEGNLDASDFFKWIFSGDEHAKPFTKEAKQFVLLQDVVGIRVTHSGNYTHSESMDVEIEVTGEEMDLVPEKYREEVTKFYNEKQFAFEDWEHAKRTIEHERNTPIREWNKRMDERSRMLKRGPKEWRPAMNPPRPQPLDLPYPPEPDLDIPVRIQRMMDQAVRTFADLSGEAGGHLLNDFQAFIQEWVRDTSRELEKIGEGEMEYRQSDEAITEFLEANEYTFDEEGTEL